MARPPLAPPQLSPVPMEPGLYLVATPIGNLRDITLRALDVLAACDLILAEDTRVTGKLLAAYGISKRIERCDDHAAERIIPRVLERLAEGGKIALVTVAGTPLVSDPGFVVARAVSAAGPGVWPKAAARRTFFEDLASVRASLIFYEGGSRLAASLADMAQAFGDRPAAVCRELTKLYETVTRGTLSELAANPAFAEPRGELVVVVGPGADAPASAADVDTALKEALTRLAPGPAAAEVARQTGASRKGLYARALELKGGQ